MTAAVAAVAMMAQDATTAKKSPTSPSDSSLTQSLNREISRLTGLVDTWNNRYVLWLIASIILTAISIGVAVGTVYSQHKTIRFARELSDAQQRLDSAKDRELTHSLKDKDVEIQNAKLAASVADERAGRANEAAGIANDSAARVGERAAKLESDNLRLRTDLENAVSESRSKQADLEREQQRTARAQQEAADAQRKLNEAIVTRVLGRQIRSDFVENLKRVPPAKAEIFCAEESESRWYAILLLNALRDAKWDVPREPIPIPLAQFNGTKLPLFGNSLSARNLKKGFLPFGGRGVDPAILTQLLGLTDVRFGVLASGIDIAAFEPDPTLQADVFKIVIGPRDPTQ